MIKHWTVYKMNPVTGAFEFKKRVATYDDGLDFIAVEIGQDRYKLFNESVQLPDGSFEVKTPVPLYQLVHLQCKRSCCL